MTDRLRKQHRFATVPEHLIRDQSLSDRAFRVWCILDRYAGAADSAFPLRRTLAADLDCSPASLDRAITELTEGGWLHKERRGKGESNVYTLLVAKVPSISRRRSVREGGVVTGEDRGVVTGEDSPVVTGEDTLSSQVRTPVVMGDEHKEEPSKEASPKESTGAVAPGSRDLNEGREDVEKVCTHLAARLKERDVRVTDPMSKRWRDAARLLMDADGRTERQVHNMIEWSQNDEFWRTVVHSMPNLREHYDRMKDKATGSVPANLHTTPGTPGHEQRRQALGG